MVRTCVVDEVARNVVVASEPVCASVLLCSATTVDSSKAIEAQSLTIEVDSARQQSSG